MESTRAKPISNINSRNEKHLPTRRISFFYICLSTQEKNSIRKTLSTRNKKIRIVLQLTVCGIILKDEIDCGGRMKYNAPKERKVETICVQYMGNVWGNGSSVVE